jgi:hypothetical protein
LGGSVNVGELPPEMISKRGRIVFQQKNSELQSSRTASDNM